MSALLSATLLLLSVLHLGTVISTSSVPETLATPAVLYLIARLYLFRTHRNRRNLPSLLNEIAVAFTMEAILADFILNTVSYEPDLNAGRAYRWLQLGLLWGIPAASLFLTSRRWKALFPLLGLWLLFSPPWSITLLQTIIVPEYGLTAGLLLLAATPRWRRLLSFRRGRAILLPILALPLAAVPALLHGISIASSLDHIIQLLIFGAAAWTAAGVLQRSQQLLRFCAAAAGAAVPNMIFLLAFGEDLHAVNANFSAMGMEMVLFLSIVAATLSRKRWTQFAAALIAGVTLLAQYRIASTTGLLASLGGIAFWAYLKWVQPAIPARLRTPVIVTGFIAPIVAGTLYLVYGTHADSIISRVFMWRTALGAVFSNPFRTVFGFGDFGYFFYFVFRNFQRALTPAEFYILDHLEPFLVIQHPHNDGMMMLYGGGFLHLLLMIALVALLVAGGIRLMNSGKKEGPVFIAAVFTILFHGVTEPFISTFATGFFFWLVLGIVLFRPIQGSSLRLCGATTLSFLAAAFLLLIALRVGGQALRIPAIKFWGAHRELMFHFKQGPGGGLPAEDRKRLTAQAEKARGSLRRASVLQPAQFDLIRQEAEIEALLFRLTGDEDHLRASHDLYCRAFTFRMAPIHYAGVLRTGSGLTLTPEAYCPGRPELRPRISGYDPGNMLRFIPPEFL